MVLDFADFQINAIIGVKSSELQSKKKMGQIYFFSVWTSSSPGADEDS